MKKMIVAAFVAGTMLTASLANAQQTKVNPKVGAAKATQHAAPKDAVTDPAMGKPTADQKSPAKIDVKKATAPAPRQETKGQPVNGKKMDAAPAGTKDAKKPTPVNQKTGK